MPALFSEDARQRTELFLARELARLLRRWVTLEGGMTRRTMIAGSEQSVNMSAMTQVRVVFGNRIQTSNALALVRQIVMAEDGFAQARSLERVEFLR